MFTFVIFYNNFYKSYHDYNFSNIKYILFQSIIRMNNESLNIQSIKCDNNTLSMYL